ncbi:MAG: SPOR domain-containing protein [Candidatus Dadabacteria bacterium]|nr:SPOR domain-containing protein [Candidatus Dadabacteria bacterium]
MVASKNKPSNWQIVYFFLGFVILFIFTFSLGVIVGKGLGSPETLIISEEVTPKTPGQEIKEFEEETKTEKDKELKNDSPTHSTEGSETVEEKIGIETTPDEPDEEPVETTEDDSKISESTSLKPSPTPLLPMEKKPVLETEQAQAKSSPIPTPIKKQAKLEPKKEVIKKKETATLRTPQPEGRYTVQVGAFQKEEEAKQIVNNLKSKGYPAFIKTAGVSGKGALYRVRIGRFNTREVARVYAINLKNLEPSIKFVFVTVND